MIKLLKYIKNYNAKNINNFMRTIIGYKTSDFLILNKAN